MPAGAVLANFKVASFARRLLKIDCYRAAQGTGLILKLLFSFQIYLFLGHLCMTYMVAFVCSLAFEAPFMALEKLILRKGRRS